MQISKPLRIISMLLFAGTLSVLVASCDNFLGSDGSDNGGNGNENGSFGDINGDEVNTEIAEQKVLAFLQDLGFFDSEYFQQSQLNVMSSTQDQQDNVPPVPDDYLVSEDVDGNIYITMDIDRDGNILPNREWRDNNNSYCLEQGKSFKTPAWKLRVELHPETQDVFLRLIDIDTGQIESPASAQVPGDSWVDDGISEAWDSADLPQIQQAGSPCGADVQLTLTFDSEMAANADGGVEVTRVQANIPLGDNSDPEVFEGTSALILTDYSAGGAGCPIVSTTNGTISAQVTIPDGSFDSVSIDDLQGMIDVSIRIVPDESPIATFDCGATEITDDTIWYRWFHVLNQSQDSDAPFSYFYGSLWDEMKDAPFGLAKGEIEQLDTFTEEGDTLTLEEITTLEIWTKELPPL